MGVFGRIVAAASQYRTSDGWTIGAGGGPSKSGVDVGCDSAMRLMAVKACVSLIADNVAAFPLKIYREREDGGKELAKKHPLYQVLFRRPNKWQSSFEFRQGMMYHLLLRGNAYAKINYGLRGAVTDLIPLDPDRVFPQRARVGGPIVYKYFPSAPEEPKTWLADEIFHLRGLSKDGVVGLNPIELAREAIGLGLAEEEYGARMFSNGAQLSGIISVPGKLTDLARKNIDKSILRRHAGLRNAWRPMVLEQGSTWTNVSMRARDAEWLDSRKFQVSEIARMFRVPPHMIADITNSTSWGTGIEQQQIGFYVTNLLIWATLWEQTIYLSLLTYEDERTGDLVQLEPGGEYYAKHVVDAFLRGDTTARYTAHEKAINSGWKKPDEVRLDEDMNPVGGDAAKLRRPANFLLEGERAAADGPQRGEGTGRTDEDDEAERTAARLTAYVLSAAESIAEKEAAALRRLSKFRAADLEERLDAFYSDFSADVERRLFVPFDTARAFALRSREAAWNAISDGGSARFLNGWSTARVVELTALANEVKHA